MSDEIKRIDIKEFREFGYLQEVNRLFFHPLGLALEIVIEEDGSERLGGLWDYRDDPEGVIFGEEDIDNAKGMRVSGEQLKKRYLRESLLGYIIQPLPIDREILESYGNE